MACQKPSLQKIEAFISIQNSLKQVLKQEDFLKEYDWDILVYGSVLNSICTNEHSDLDLTLIINPDLKHYSVLKELL